MLVQENSDLKQFINELKTTNEELRAQKSVLPSSPSIDPNSTASQFLIKIVDLETQIMSLTVNKHTPLPNSESNDASLTDTEIRAAYSNLLIDYNNMKQIAMQQKLDFLQLKSTVEYDLNDRCERVFSLFFVLYI